MPRRMLVAFTKRNFRLPLKRYGELSGDEKCCNLVAATMRQLF